MDLKIKNIYFPILSVIILGMVTLSGLKAQAQPSDKAEAKAFVQKFYDWYVPLYNQYVPGKRNQVPSEKVALVKQKDCFDAKLYSVLFDYYNKPAPKGAEDVMGIDMDPFLAAQDNGFQYVAGKTTQSAGDFFVDVHGDLENKPRSEVLKGQLAIVVELAKVNGQWKFLNFWYDKKSNLLSMIASYNKDVKAEVAKKH
ncbi:DUF3828 domain-containing protein [Mucilaginibacter sp. dw_454]|uniref:DUF3828 domain-containing protein n=1 Tax=Mucilaginibacter sp. dw_454 TaxID=2720079 RepID=UPI001BD357AC|nr:DUF3828 domain-containing protein [Mucilaginibacter sp. dw_454]